MGLPCLVEGCDPAVDTLKPLTFPTDKDSVVFGVSGVTKSSITNREGLEVEGLTLAGASLIRDEDDLMKSKHQRFVIFRDFLLGNMVRGSYWRQQSEKRKDFDLPVMDTRATKVILVTVDRDPIVTDRKVLRAAHVQLSVDTNDFVRPFSP